MSLLNWLFPKKSAAATTAIGAQELAGTAPTSERRAERAQRREQLYLAVRDTMVRSGVLSSGYKFKVLSLDPAGHQFLVMIDIAQSHGGEVARQREMETLLTQIARSRFHIQVIAVYWRVNSALAAAAARPEANVPAAPASRPEIAPTVAMAAPVAALQAAALPASAPGFEPIAPDEVAALQEALREAPAAPPRKAPVLEPDPEPAADGFADTVIAADDELPYPGATEYGGLR